MSFATDGDTEELAPGYLRRPISVAQLLEREGYQPAVRSRTARRALSGVAAGAVLTLGAVVGSLFLNHGQRTTGDIAAAGLGQSGGDIVLAESNTPPDSTPAATTHTPVTTSHTRTVHPPRSTPTVTHHNGTDNHPTTTHRAATTQPTTTTKTTQSTTRLSQHTATTRPTTQSLTTTQPTTTQPTTTQPTTTETTTPPTTTQPDNGGLLGGVGQVLGSVTQPVFDWFN